MNMKAIAALIALAGCGTVFNDPKTEVEVVNPNGFSLTLDGLPVKGNTVSVDNRKDHMIVATDKDGKAVGSCDIVSHVQGRYVVGDIFLGVLPIVVDALTGDWSQVEDTRCVL